MPDARLLTVAEAAEISRFSKRTIQRKLQCGELPALRIRRSVRIRYDDLISWLTRHTVGGDR